MAQFKSIEPYHWPGWFITGLAVVYATIVVLTFSEPRPFRRLKGFLSCKCWTGLKLSFNLRSGWKIRLIVSHSKMIYLHVMHVSYVNTAKNPIVVISSCNLHVIHVCTTENSLLMRDNLSTSLKWGIVSKWGDDSLREKLD